MPGAVSGPCQKCGPPPSQSGFVDCHWVRGLPSLGFKTVATGAPNMAPFLATCLAHDFFCTQSWGPKIPHGNEKIKEPARNLASDLGPIFLKNLSFHSGHIFSGQLKCGILRDPLFFRLLFRATPPGIIRDMRLQRLPRAKILTISGGQPGERALGPQPAKHSTPLYFHTLLP